MSTPAKPAPTHQDLRTGNLYRVAIVGAGTLKGKEVAEVLNDRNFPAVDVKLLDDDESLGQLEAMGDEVTFIQSVRNEQFDRVDFTFFASDPVCTRNNWKTVRDAGSTILDLSYALEIEPDASIRSPWIERQMGTPVVPSLQPGPVVIAHPAAVVLALIALRARKAASIERMDDPVVVRRLRDVGQKFSTNRRTVILMGPRVVIPPELASLVEFLELPLPDRQRLRQLIDETVVRVAKSHTLQRKLDPNGLDALAENLRGLTEEEAERALSQALVSRYSICPETVTDVIEAKKSLLKRQEMLEFVPSGDSMSRPHGLNHCKANSVGRDA